MSKTYVIEKEIRRNYDEMREIYRQIKSAISPMRPEKFDFSADDYSEEKYKDYKQEMEKSYERADKISDLYTELYNKNEEITRLLGSMNLLERIGFNYYKIKACKLTVHAYAEACIKFFENSGLEGMIRNILEEYDIDYRNASTKVYYTTLSRISHSIKTYDSVTGYDKTFANHGMHTYECW